MKKPRTSRTQSRQSREVQGGPRRKQSPTRIQEPPSLQAAPRRTSVRADKPLSMQRKTCKGERIGIQKRGHCCKQEQARRGISGGTKARKNSPWFAAATRRRTNRGNVSPSDDDYWTLSSAATKKVQGPSTTAGGSRVYLP
jgi:hypothetical protein